MAYLGHYEKIHPFNMKTEIECSICKRTTPPEFKEKHHLVPRSKNGTETIDVCCNCGDQVHNLFTNKELEKEYNTLEALLGNPDIQKWVKWVSKQAGFSFSMKSKKQR